MEYNNSNFKCDFENIKSLIDDCDFLSVDTELTGLLEEAVNYYDTPDLRYKFVRDYAMKYTVTQVGMCLFKFNPEEKCFNYFPLNFLLKPSVYNSEKSNFLINVSTIGFLQKHNFDFNHNWKEGIPFTRYSDIEDQKIIFERKSKRQIGRLDEFDVDEFDFSNLSNLIEQCNEFLLNDSQNELEIDIPPDWLKKYLILNHLWKKVGCTNGEWILPTLDKEKQKIRIIKTLDPQFDMEQNISKRFEEKLVKFSDNALFTQLIKHISDSHKLIIAHNSFLDIMHIMDKFVEPLPENYSDFKNKLNKYFPKIFDTKYIFGDEKFKNLKANNLEAIYEAIKKDPFISPDQMTKPAGDQYDFGEQVILHTAHYDAMITGKAFIALVTNLAENKTEFWNNINTEIPDFLKKYLNRVRVVKAEFGALNLNLGCNENLSSRQHIFHMTIPDEWEREDIITYLCGVLKKPFKMLFEQVNMSWMSSTSLMIKLPTCIDVKQVPNWNNDELVKVVSFRDYYGLNNNNNGEVDEDGFCEVKRKRSRVQ